jgi:hypothetical protein
MRENITSLLIVFLLVLVNIVLGVENSETIEVAQNYKFSTSTYSCTLHKTGMILYIKAYDKRLLSSVILFGDVIYNKKRARIIQNAKATTWKLIKGEQQSIFIVTANLFTKSKEALAEFEQETILKSRQIKFHYKLTTKKTLTIKGVKPFYSLLSVPIEDYLENSMDIIEKNGDESIWEIPKIFQKNGVSLPNKKRIQKAEFSFKNRSFSIIIPPNEQSWMRISDARAWKSQKLEILLMPILLRKYRKDITYPAGTVFKWKFTLDFN